MNYSYSCWCKVCNIRKSSIREGSFFSKSKVTLQKWLLLLYLGARECPVSDASEEAEIHIGTGIDIYQWLREVCSVRLLSSPIILCGPNTVFQIDESLFRQSTVIQDSLAGRHSTDNLNSDEMPTLNHHRIYITWRATYISIIFNHSIVLSKTKIGPIFASRLFGHFLN